MELWFILALASAVFGGLFIFITKVAAERDYDVVLMSTTSLTISAVVLFVITYFVSDFSGITSFLLLVAFINAVTYMSVNILRHNAMRCIDTAIYYPIYKTITPAFTILAGVIFFAESFTRVEWIGLILSLLVPLLLVSVAEKGRQKDLIKGLKLLLLASILAVISTVVLKAGTEHTGNIWLFIAMTDTGVAIAGVLVLLAQKNKRPLIERCRALYDKKFRRLIFWLSIFQVTGFASLVLAISGGPLGIVYTINSLYILIPIVLSIIYYHEHWNARKVIAIGLSIAALALLH